VAQKYYGNGGVVLQQDRTSSTQVFYTMVLRPQDMDINFSTISRFSTIKIFSAYAVIQLLAAMHQQRINQSINV
jgi:hypothetical protein